MLLFRTCNGQKLLQRLFLTFSQFLRLFICISQIHAAVSAARRLHWVLLRQRSDIPQNRPAAHLEFICQFFCGCLFMFSKVVQQLNSPIPDCRFLLTGNGFALWCHGLSFPPDAGAKESPCVLGLAAGKADWKNPYQKMSAIETQDFQRHIQTLLRLKFPYESSFALLQLRHWLFCFG